jgi:DNA-binding NarL/FixJ family response regulator
MMGSVPIRVLCVDDRHVVREGIAATIDLQRDMNVIAAATGEEAIELFRQHQPDVTLVDLQLPGIGGLDAIRTIRRECPDARIVVVTMSQGERHLSSAAGGRDYLFVERQSEDDLARIFREAHAGGRPIPPNVEALFAARVDQSTLTPREVEVIELIAGLAE